MALGVHLFTASGALWGFLALVAAVRGNMQEMWLWLAVALFVDGIDGTMARRVGVETAMPRYSGVYLDLVVDFLTYVLVPTYALATSNLLPVGWNIAAAAIILVTSAMYFASNEMKTDDAWFRGFPAIWNVVVFYLFLYEPPPWATFAAVVVLGVLTFAPVVFVHPFRVALLRGLTIALLAIWSIAAVFAIYAEMQPPSFVIWILTAIAIYFLGLGVLRGSAFDRQHRDNS
jgi:phosphatidylcholine synthase